ncbi:hypothetical protein TrST_g2429 [Triparma strigata]|uniref:Uncharacterized protein n=1 Tax=Triparma strigata TaxID=1606541 RepID=A0A9W6ZPM0_9STRA|nr:hypothetical protein TrST_g2429 [Triparma strigata]
MILNAQDDDDAHIIELLNQGSDNRPPAPSKTVPAHLKADFLSTPPPPPLKVAVDSISSASSSSSCDSDSESDSNTNNDDAKRVHAQLTKKQSQCSHLPRWRIRQPSPVQSDFKSPSPTMLRSPPYMRGGGGGLAFPVCVTGDLSSPAGGEGTSPRISRPSTPLGMPQHLVEGIEELGLCSRKLLFDDSGEIADMHVLLDDKELVDLGMGEGGVGRQPTRKKKKKPVVERPPWVAVDVGLASDVNKDVREANNAKQAQQAKEAQLAVNRGSINSGALREKKPLKKTPVTVENVKEEKPTLKLTTPPKRKTNEKENKPSPILMTVSSCNLGQHLNGFDHKEYKKEPRKEPIPTSRPRTSSSSSTKKKKEPFKPKKVDRVAAFHAVQSNRKLDDKKKQKMRMMRASYGAA